MKYVDTKVVFAEVPDEISLAINIANCPNRCDGCHSPYLQKDEGKKLNWGSLNALIHINNGITCVALMGGDNNPKEVNNLAYHIKKTGLKVCWYSGNSTVSKDIQLENFDYIKVGPYMKDRGPLNNKNTNQRFYAVKSMKLVDITNKFWKTGED